MCMYYIAYGSNLNVEQMKYRCPTAKIVGKTVLPNLRLRFRGHKNNAVATIEPKKGYCVPVGIWKIEKHDEEALDIYEGYPRFYRKETLEVPFGDKTIQALVYIMNENYPYNNPSFEYVRIIRDGYIAFDLDRDILRIALLEARG